MEHLSMERFTAIVPDESCQIDTDDLFGPIISYIPDGHQHPHENGNGSLYTNVESGRFAGDVQISADTVSICPVAVPQSIHIPDLQLDARLSEGDYAALPNPALASQLEEPSNEAPSLNTHLPAAHARRNSEAEAEAAAASSALTPVPESPSGSHRNGNGSNGSLWRLPLVDEKNHGPINISIAPIDRFSMQERPEDVGSAGEVVVSSEIVSSDSADPAVLSATSREFPEIAEMCGVSLQAEAQATIEDPMESFVLATTEADDEQWLEFLREQFCISTREDGSRIDKTLRQMQEHRKTGVSVDDSSLIWRLLPKNYFQAVLLCMFLIYSYLFVRDGIVLGWGDHEHASEFRFKVLELRENTLPPTIANIGEVGVNFYDCAHTPVRRQDGGATVTLAFDSMVKINEWYFVTAGTDPALDPISFEVEVRNLRGQSELLPAPDFHNSLARAGSKSYTWHVLLALRPPLLFSVAQFIGYGLIAAGNLAALLMCRKGTYMYARRTLAVTLGLVGVTSWVVVLAMMATRRWRLALTWARTVVATTLLTPPVAHETLEPMLIPCLMAAGLGYLVLLATDLYTDGKQPEEIFMLHEPYACVLAVALGLLLSSYRRKKIRRVKEAVQEHKQEFDAAWERELSQLGEKRAELQELRDLIRNIRYQHQNQHHRRPHQRLCKSRKGEEKEKEKEKERTFQSQMLGVLRKVGSYNTSSLRSDPSGPTVQSLDQLYAQARCCLPLVREVAQRAALRSGGSFPLTVVKDEEPEGQRTASSFSRGAASAKEGEKSRVSSIRSARGGGEEEAERPGGEEEEGAGGEEAAERVDASPAPRRRPCIKWEEAVNDVECSSAIVWTALKPESRAVEKVLHRYRGDVRWLLDVCRETIVLDSISNVIRCLEALAADPKIVIERVKNSLDDKHPGSAGFRGVVVNLRVVTPETRAVACDGHVCELLLVLASFFEALSEEGHEKYLNYRRHVDSKEFLKRMSEWGSCWRGCLASKRRHAQAHGPEGIFASFAGESFRRGSMVGSRRGSLPSRRGSQASVGARRRGSVASLESWDLTTHTHTSSLAPQPGSARRSSYLDATRHSASGRHSMRRGSAQHALATLSLASNPNLGSSAKHPWPRTLQNVPVVGEEEQSAPPASSAALAGGELASRGHSHSDSASNAAGAMPPPGQTPLSSISLNLGHGASSPGPTSPFGASGKRRRMGGWHSFKSVGSGWSSEDFGRTNTGVTASSNQYGSGRLMSRTGSRRRGEEEDENGEGGMEPLRGGVKKHGAWYKLLEQAYRERTTHAGSRLDDKAKNLSVAVSNAERFSVFETSFPIAAAMSKRWFPKVVLVLGLVYLIAATVGGIRIHKNGRLESSRVRFRPLLLRDESRDPAEARVGVVGLMSGECLVPLRGQEGSGWPREFVLGDGSAPVSFNGFYFQTWVGDRAVDPLVVALDRWDEEAGEWMEAGDSSLTFSVSGYPESVAGQGQRSGVGPPSEDKALVSVDLRSSYFVWLQIVWADLLRGITWVGLAAAALKQKYRWGQPLLVSGLALCAVCMVSGAAGHTVWHARWGGALHWAMAVVVLGMAVGMERRPQWFIEIVLATGSGAILIYAVDDALGKSRPARWAGAERISCFVLVVIGTCLWLLRWRARREAEAQIQDDLRKYEEAWGVVGQDLDAIQQIENIVSTLPAKASGHVMQRFVPSKSQEPRKIRRWIFSDGKKLKKKVMRTATLLRTSSVTAQFRNWRHHRRASNAGGSRTSSIGSQISVQDAHKVYNGARRASSSGGRMGRRTSSSGNTVAPMVSAAVRRMSAVNLNPPAHHPSDISPHLGPSPAAEGGGSPRLPSGLSNDGGEGGLITPMQSLRESSETISPLAAAPAALWEEAESPSIRMRSRRGSSVRSEAGKLKGTRRAAVFKERQGDDTGELSEQLASQLAEAQAAAAAATPNGRKEGGHLFSRFGHHGADEPQSTQPAVESLDQLYAQAKGAQPLLKYKVQAWAHASKGMFCVRPDPVIARQRDGQPTANEFTKWESICHDPGAEKSIKWGTLKSSDRAIEKLVRSYEGKVGRLLDVCRQSIAFTSLQDLAKCLELIADDEQVAIVAVKNRLSHNYDAKAHSLGYRDVNINLRFTNPLAEKLCIHLHICEVQLLLTPFATLKTSVGHKRYVAFRNARGK